MNARTHFFYESPRFTILGTFTEPFPDCFLYIYPPRPLVPVEYSYIVKGMEYTVPEGSKIHTRSKKKTFMVAVVVVVLLIIVVLGYLKYVKQASSVTGSDEEEKETELRQAQQKLLIAPGESGINPGEYADEVAHLAVESNTITVTADCSMDPLIIKMREGSVLKLNNQDVSEHVFVFEDENFFAVPAGQVREINITQVFGKGEGIYRYRCGDHSRAENVGIMYLVK